MKKKWNWKIEIRFVPFESEEQRDEAYRLWVKAWLRAKEKKLKT